MTPKFTLENLLTEIRTLDLSRCTLAELADLGCVLAEKIQQQLNLQPISMDFELLDELLAMQGRVAAHLGVENRYEEVYGRIKSTLAALRQQPPEPGDEPL